MTCIAVPALPCLLGVPSAACPVPCTALLSGPTLRIQITFDQAPLSVLNQIIDTPHCNGQCWRYNGSGGFYADKISEVYVPCPSGQATLQAQVNGGLTVFLASSTETGTAPSPYVGQIFHFIDGVYTATVTVLGYST